MIKRTLYFGNPTKLSLHDRQLVAEINDPDQGRRTANASVEDAGVVILDSPQITITQPLLAALLENNVAVITCNAKHMPHGLLMPLESNILQQERFDTQLEASLPLKKQLWQQTIVAKITNQKWLLDKQGYDTEPMNHWIRSVKSGDPDNLEGRAAAFYWKTLFSVTDVEQFVRGRYEEEPNNLLNYGYAVLRAVVARSLVASGLLPTLGIHHANRYNAFCLADDIMEPYRPFVDRVVLGIVKSGVDYTELTKELKAQLLIIPTIDVILEEKSSPLMVGMQRTTASLAACYAGTTRRILYPSFE